MMNNVILCKKLKIISGVPNVTSVEAEVNCPVGEENKVTLHS